MKSNTLILDNIISFVEKAKEYWEELSFFHFGSIAENSKSWIKSYYNIAKKVARNKMEESGVCNFYINFGIVYGNNPRMVEDFKNNICIFQNYPSILHSFKMSCIHVDVLITRLVTIIKNLNAIGSKRESMIEIIILDKELSLYELINSVLPYQLKNNRRRLVPLFLKYLMLNLSIRRSPFIRRLALFLRLGMLQKNPIKQRKKNHYLSFGTIEEIQNYIVTKNYMDIIFLKDNNTFIYEINDKYYLIH